MKAEKLTIDQIIEDLAIEISNNFKAQYNIKQKTSLFAMDKLESRLVEYDYQSIEDFKKELINEIKKMDYDKFKNLILDDVIKLIKMG